MQDDFWTTETQPGSGYSDRPTEPNWMMQTIMALLSTGPFGPADMVGGANVTNIMRACR